MAENFTITQGAAQNSSAAKSDWRRPQPRARAARPRQMPMPRVDRKATRRPAMIASRPVNFAAAPTTK